MWFLAVVIHDYGPGMREAHERRLIGKFAAHATVHPLTAIGLHRFIRCYVMPLYADFRLQRWFGRKSTGAGALISTARLQLRRRLLLPGSELLNFFARRSFYAASFGSWQAGRVFQPPAAASASRSRAQAPSATAPREQKACEAHSSNAPYVAFQL